MAFSPTIEPLSVFIFLYIMGVGSVVRVGIIFNLFCAFSLIFSSQTGLRGWVHLVWYRFHN